jgi:thioredoxin-dependent peroxiredoxin
VTIRDGDERQNMTIEAGAKFPEFTAPTQDGQTVNLSEYRDGNNLIVFFYPKATTRGCVKETTEFGVRREEFDAIDTRIVGVSVDDPALQKEHAIQCAANFPLLSDTDKHLTEELGILNERGQSTLTTYLVDKSGTIAKVFDTVTVDGHVDEVLAAAKALA